MASSYERLSSGLRINRAADDAAGVAVSSKLGMHARVYGQALRNANDGISAINIAEGAVTQLSEILIRIKELAEGASNGTLALTQRRSLDTEAKALTDEFNRILSGTKFNRNKLIDGSLGELGIQLGFGSNGRLALGVGEGLERNVGTGAFTYTNPNYTANTEAVADFNGDGRADVILGVANAVVVDMSDATGAQNGGNTELASGVLAFGVGAADVNNDGKMDALYFEWGSTILRVRHGNGDGTFGAEAQTASGGVLRAFGGAISIADFNGDGHLDVAAGSLNGTSVFLNNQSGGFSSGVVYSGNTSFYGTKSGDLNGDGRVDIIANNGYYLGNGDGTFGGWQSNGSGDGLFDVGDFNQDGILDIVRYSEGDSSLYLLRGLGDETFAAAVDLGDRGAFGVELEDYNGDGLLDLVTVGASIVASTGNGDGTFGTPVTSTFGFGGGNALLADFTGDGVLDLQTGGARYLASSTTTNNVQRFNLTTADEALSTLDLLDEYMARVTEELGNLGSAQSRLQSAVNTISRTRENYFAAYIRIVDVDVADETSKLLVNQIRQQAAAAIMAQANQAPSLALVLLAR